MEDTRPSETPEESQKPDGDASLNDAAYNLKDPDWDELIKKYGATNS